MTGTSRVALDRARELMSGGRDDLATRVLREHLATDPDDGEAHALLSLTLVNQGQAREAEVASVEALRLAPGLAVTHIARGATLISLERYEEAIAVTNQILELNPSSVQAWRLLTHARFNQRRWSDAIAAADMGLALDPTDADLLAIRARAMTQMGRHQEAAQTISGALQFAPSNTNAHIAQGFAHLHGGRAQAAVESFGEALRLDPGNEGARAGLVEAMKGRNPVYALMLRWFLWTSRLGPRGTVILILGYLGAQRIGAMMARNPETAFLGTVLVAVLLGFGWSTFAAVPLFNMILMADPVGRHALHREERREAMLVAALVAVGVLGLLAALVTGSQAAVIVGVLGLSLVIPVHVAFSCQGPIARLVPTGIAVVMVLAAVYGILVPVRPGSTSISTPLVLALWAVATTWIAIPVTRWKR